MSIDNIQKQLQGLLEDSSTNTNELGLIYELDLPLTTSADASTAVSEHAWVPIPFAGIVQSARVTQSASLAADTTNYATINLIKRDAAGINNTTVATRANSTAMLQYAGNAMTVTAANAVVVAGGALSLSVTKTGTGASTSAGRVLVRILKTGS